MFIKMGLLFWLKVGVLFGVVSCCCMGLLFLFIIMQLIGSGVWLIGCLFWIRLVMVSDRFFIGQYVKMVLMMWWWLLMFGFYFVLKLLVFIVWKLMFLVLFFRYDRVQLRWKLQLFFFFVFWKLKFVVQQCDLLVVLFIIILWAMLVSVFLLIIVLLLLIIGSGWEVLVLVMVCICGLFGFILQGVVVLRLCRCSRLKEWLCIRFMKNRLLLFICS